MNGDARVILDKIIAIETKQEERHHENKQDMNVIFKKLEKLDNLKCAVHEERMNNFNGELRVMWTIIIMVIILGIVLGVWIKII